MSAGPASPDGFPHDGPACALRFHALRFHELRFPARASTERAHRGGRPLERARALCEPGCMTDAHGNDGHGTDATELSAAAPELPTAAPASVDAVATEVGADVDRAPIADVGSAAFEAVETYAPDEVFQGASTYG